VIGACPRRCAGLLRLMISDVVAFARECRFRGIAEVIGRAALVRLDVEAHFLLLHTASIKLDSGRRGFYDSFMPAKFTIFDRTRQQRVVLVSPPDAFHLGARMVGRSRRKR
jgi:hypothetical protein